MAIKIRYVIVALTVMSTMVDYLTRVNINVALVAMANENSSGSDAPLHDVCPIPKEKLDSFDKVSRHERSDRARTFDWDEKTQGLILGSFFYSYVLMQVPSARMAEVFGGKWIVAVCLLGSALINLITPLAASSVVLLCSLRVLLGFMQGGIFPACFSILFRWLPLNERGPSYGLLDSGGNIGTVAATFLAGYLSDHGFAGGWPSVFYVCGTVAVAGFIAWTLMVKSNPEDHKMVSTAELEKINGGRFKEMSDSLEVRVKPPVPWRDIFTSKAILSAIFLRFTIGYVYQVLQSKLPRYLNNILHVPHTMNGLMNGLLYITVILTMSTGGFMSEKVIRRGWLTRTKTRKLFAIISRSGTCICLLFIPIAGCSQLGVMALLIGSMFFFGLCSGSDNPLPGEMSIHFPATLYALTNMGAASAGFVAPYVVGILLESSSDIGHAWNVVFVSTSAVAALGAIVFLVFGSAERQPFDTKLDMKSLRSVHSKSRSLSEENFESSVESVR